MQIDMDLCSFADMHLGEVVKQRREAIGLSQAELARRVGVTSQTISYLEIKGTRTKFLAEIADALGLDLENFKAVGAQLVLRGDDPPSVQPLEDHFDFSRAIIDVDVRVGLGAGGIPEIMTEDIADGDGAVRGYWNVPDYLLRAMRVPAQRIRVFEADGDSMRNEHGGGVLDGDIVFVDIGHRIPSPPGIYALHDGFGVILKRVEILPATDPIRVRVSSDNPKHEPRELCLDEINVIGRYLRRLTSS